MRFMTALYIPKPQHKLTEKEVFFLWWSLQSYCLIPSNLIPTACETDWINAHWRLVVGKSTQNRAENRYKVLIVICHVIYKSFSNSISFHNQLIHILSCRCILGLLNYLFLVKLTFLFGYNRSKVMFPKDGLKLFFMRHPMRSRSSFYRAPSPSTLVFFSGLSIHSKNWNLHCFNTR